LYPDYARLLVRSRILPSKTPPRGLHFFAIPRAFAAMLAMTPLSGCSIVTAANSDVDTQATGAIAPRAGTAPPGPSAALPAGLDDEDSRRALGALGIALDPQGNGATVRWDNPVSKAHGFVTPAGFAYPENGLICRKFSARFESAAGAESHSGAACRDKSADWTLTEIHKVADAGQ
jgi:surface antigen